MRKQYRPLSCCSKEERNKGRLEKRMVKVYAASKPVQRDWDSAKTIIYVKRIRKVKDKRSKVTHAYYLSSVSKSASEFLKGIRAHWGIENRLHYIKDVSFNEDSSKIKSGNSAGIFSLIRNLAINIARLNNAKGVKSFIRQCAGNLKLIMSFLE